MLSWRQDVSIALYLFVGALCFWLARAQARPEAGGAGPRRAVLAFQAFWLGLGADALVGAGQILAAAFDPGSGTLAGELSIVAYVFVSILMWGLLTYLLFLFTGRSSVLLWVALLYAVVFIDSVAFVVGGSPTGMTPTLWGAKAEYASTPSLASALFLSAAFLLPPFVGAIAYGTLALQVRGAARRYRVASVSLGILVWFSTTIVLSLPDLLDNDAVQGGGRLITLFAILAIVVSYRPPAPLRRRLDLHHAQPHVALTPGEREDARRRLMERVESLI